MRTVQVQLQAVWKMGIELGMHVDGAVPLVLAAAPSCVTGSGRYLMSGTMLTGQPNQDGTSTALPYRPEAAAIAAAPIMHEHQNATMGTQS